MRGLVTLNLRSKGSIGMTLEQLLGLPSDNCSSDFLDTELKTGKAIVGANAFAHRGIHQDCMLKNPMT